MKSFSKMRGFTLLELMIVVILIVVFAAFVVPTFKNRMQRAKVESYVDELLTALRYARSEAIARGTDVHLAPKDGAAALDEGWTVATKSFRGVGVTLREHNPLNGVLICQAPSPGVCGTEITFTFTPRGSMRVDLGGTVASSVSLLARPVDYNNVSGDPSAGTGVLLDVGTLGYARVSEDPTP